MLIAVLCVAATVAPAAAAQVDRHASTSCASSSLPASTAVDWFGRDTELVYVYPAGALVSPDAVPALVAVLEDHYVVVVVDDVLDVRPAINERLLIVDDALGIEGEPATYRGGRAPSLYLHSSTAVADVEDAIASNCSTAVTVQASGADSPANDAPASRPQTVPAPGGLATPGGMQAVWDVADGDAQVLTGYADDVSFDVRLPTGWDVVAPATFVTEVAASEIGREDLSLRIDLDGRPMETWTPGDPSHLEFEIDPERFAETGFGIRAFTTAPLIADPNCADAGHVGRWVDLGAPVVQAQIQPGELDVARVISGLGAISQLTQEPITMVVDADGNPALLETAGSVAAAIGHYNAPVGWHVVTRRDGVDRFGTSSLVVIEERVGEPARVAVSVEGDRAVLTLTGDAGEMVALAGSMAHPDRLVYFHGSEIDGAAIPAVAPLARQEVFGFADAGYDDRTLRGAGEKSLVYRLHIPAGVPPDRATLALYGTYAPVLAERGGTVSVRVNGSEEEIVAVADETGRLEVLHTPRPASLRPGLNFVKVTVDLGESGGQECASGPRAWLTVSEASGLAVEASDRPEPPELGVEDARFALASTADFTAADIVIANVEDPADLGQALMVIGELADRADGGAPRLVVDADASTDRHLVVIGPVGDRELLDGIVPIELGDRVGLVAAVPSPYTRGRVLLAMTGGSDEAATLAIDAALSARVNDIGVSHALIGIDRVQPLGGGDLRVEQPERLAFEEREPGPPVEDYEAWLLAQAARIESAAAPQTEVRRLVAFGLLLSAALLFGFGWIRRVRQSNTAGSSAAH